MRVEQNAPYDLRDAERVEPSDERRWRLMGHMRELYTSTLEMVNEVHSEGFAEEHPELVAQLVLANALHSLSEGVDERLFWLRDQAAALVDVMDDVKSIVRQLGKTLAESDD